MRIAQWETMLSLQVDFTCNFFTATATSISCLIKFNSLHIIHENCTIISLQYLVIFIHKFSLHDQRRWVGPKHWHVLFPFLQELVRNETTLLEMYTDYTLLAESKWPSTIQYLIFFFSAFLVCIGPYNFIGTHYSHLINIYAIWYTFTPWSDTYEWSEVAPASCPCMSQSYRTMDSQPAINSIPP